MFLSNERGGSDYILYETRKKTPHRSRRNGFLLYIEVPIPIFYFRGQFLDFLIVPVKRDDFYTSVAIRLLQFRSTYYNRGRSGIFYRTTIVTRRNVGFFAEEKKKTCQIPLTRK